MALNPDVYSDSTQTSKMELFVEKVDGFQLWTIFAESLILDFRLGSEYVSRTVDYFHKQLYLRSLNGF